MVFETVGKKLISEGIAEYFERTLNNGKDNFKDSDWPENLGDFIQNKIIYNGGLHLVKPIIDRYGKRGIETLIINPPSLEDLSNLPEYQNRVIESLSKKP